MSSPRNAILEGDMLDAVITGEELVSPERLRVLMGRSDAPGVRRLVAQTALYVGTGTGLVLASQPQWIVAFLLANALAQFAMFGMLHEAGHRTAFTRPWLSELAGWIAALAQPMSPALFRAFHFEHHRHTHELTRDPELAGLEFVRQWPRGLGWILTLTGLPILAARWGWALFAATWPAGALWDRVLPFVRPDRRSRTAWEARLLLLVHGTLLVVALLAWPQLGRLYAAMIVGHAILSWYVTCEHRGLPEGGSILSRTRSLVTPPWLRWLLWNMPYHAEHHAYPAVPFHALPALHQEVSAHLVHRVSPVRLYSSPGN